MNDHMATIIHEERMATLRREATEARLATLSRTAEAKRAPSPPPDDVRRRLYSWSTKVMSIWAR